MVKTLTNKLSEGYDFANIPKTASFLQDMSKIIDEGGDVKKLMGLRQRIANLGKGGDVDANAARELNRAFDDELTKTLDNALIFGDEANCKQMESCNS